MGTLPDPSKPGKWTCIKGNASGWLGMLVLEGLEYEHPYGMTLTDSLTEECIKVIDKARTILSSRGDDYISEEAIVRALGIVSRVYREAAEIAGVPISELSSDKEKLEQLPGWTSYLSVKNGALDTGGVVFFPGLYGLQPLRIPDDFVIGRESTGELVALSKEAFIEREKEIRIVKNDRVLSVGYILSGSRRRVLSGDADTDYSLWLESLGRAEMFEGKQYYRVEMLEMGVSELFSSFAAGGFLASLQCKSRMDLRRLSTISGLKGYVSVDDLSDFMSKPYYLFQCVAKVVQKHGREFTAPLEIDDRYNVTNIGRVVIPLISLASSAEPEDVLHKVLSDGALRAVAFMQALISRYGVQYVQSYLAQYHPNQFLFSSVPGISYTPPPPLSFGH
jgi:hypothetical protein